MSTIKITKEETQLYPLSTMFSVYIQDKGIFQAGQSVAFSKEELKELRRLLNEIEI